MEERKEKFKRIVESICNFSILITQIDPDAVASANGVYHLMKYLKKDLRCDIYYSGKFAHPQNRMILNRYNLDSMMLPMSKWIEKRKGIDDQVEENEEDKIKKDYNVCLVDSSNSVDKRFEYEKEESINTCIVIDHHRNSDMEEDENKFMWIEEVGAASTLVTELIMLFDEEILKIPNVAILLALGIYTDTKALVSASSRDIHAYSICKKYIDVNEMSQLINYDLPESHFKIMSFALLHYERKDSIIVANLGFMKQDDGDEISTICDDLIRMRGVKMAFVIGIIDEFVRVSARSTDMTIPLHTFLQEKFGPQSGAKLAPDGRAEGGAIIDLSLGFWMNDATRDDIISLVEKRIFNLLLDS